jgi:hypothetical protein
MTATASKAKTPKTFGADVFRADEATEETPYMSTPLGEYFRAHARAGRSSTPLRLGSSSDAK